MSLNKHFRFETIARTRFRIAPGTASVSLAASTSGRWTLNLALVLLLIPFREGKNIPNVDLFICKSHRAAAETDTD